MDTSDQPVVAAACSWVVFMLMISFTASLCIKRRGRNRSCISKPEPKSTPEIVIDESAKHISMTEIAAATNNFSLDLCIGEGSFGLVYKGHLHSTNLMVAIKRLNRDYGLQGLREFRAEVEALCTFRHQNVVPLVGYCVSGGDRLLVYKFMENGCLYHWLHEDNLGSAPDQLCPLSWETRIKILKDVAQGLCYMHDGLKAPMIHRNIKPANILLDKDFKARLTDFGLARTVNMGDSHVTTDVNGSPGYIPPEYSHMTVATVKGDVYSFGVSMLETMTGKITFLPIAMEKGKEVRLIEWVYSMTAENRHMEMLDPSIQTEGLAGAHVEECFRIGFLCISQDPRKRPSMGQVVNLLSQVPLA